MKTSSSQLNYQGTSIQVQEDGGLLVHVIRNERGVAVQFHISALKGAHALAVISDVAFTVVSGKAILKSRSGKKAVALKNGGKVREGDTLCIEAAEPCQLVGVPSGDEAYGGSPGDGDPKLGP